MRIKTITCHDVYNVGASLQAYAMQTYLEKMGHEVNIINYKPDYLSHHYSLTYIPNPKFNKPILREAYLIAKLPARIKARASRRKRNFDAFTASYLKLTRRYNSFQELAQDPPEAEIYFAGSDQIWNPLFPNGTDPAFYLQFVQNDATKASYAASFAVESIEGDAFPRISNLIKNLNFVSVREKSAINILKHMNINGYVVCDPVFLLKKGNWEKMAVTPDRNKYHFIYDFDDSQSVKALAIEMRKKLGGTIVSAFSNKYCDDNVNDMGPLEFIGLILNADTVISNSFHATAFALIFHKEFYVIRRKEGINTRMEDMLSDMNLSDRIIGDLKDLNRCKNIDWDAVDLHIEKKVLESREYIKNVLSYGN